MTPALAVLERDRYGLPRHQQRLSNLGSFSYTANKHIIGSHGGLFPEEVVVGVLRGDNPTSNLMGQPLCGDL